VIYEDRTGTIWLGTRGGLYSLKGEEMKRYSTTDGLAGDDIKDILEDENGDLWIATYGGLSRWRSGRFDSFTSKDGLPSPYVRTLFSDGRGTLWIGTYDSGLSRFRDGKFVNYTTAEGLFSNGVFRILDDGLGNFWMSCNRGIFRVSKEQLEEFAAGKLRRVTSIAFGKDEGLVSTECNGGQQPAGIRSHDGKLWFPTQGGIAVIDPNQITSNPNPPPVVIEEALVDRSSVALSSQLQIGPGQENLEIRYAGLSFINAQHMAFRYRMEGLENDWIEAGTRRSVQYSHLAPGRYTFVVIAANADGVWNTTGARLQIVVVPPFWRTWWFLSVVSLILMGIAYTFYRYQMSRLQRAHAMQRAFSQQLIELQEGERKRIAAGLHDSLGQQLLVIKNRALLGLRTPDRPGPEQTQLEEISSLSSQALDEVREIAYDLHPYQIDRLGLTKAIQAMVRKVAAVSEIEFSTEIDNIDGVFPSHSEINIYRIVQESINNVLKHSQARTATVTIKRELQTVAISISDDGKGFLPNLEDPVRSGFGLIGIAERARMLGGSQTVHSTVGQGATIIVTLALPEKQNG
jgi:signal transduction histidine kinase